MGRLGASGPVIVDVFNHVGLGGPRTSRTTERYGFTNPRDDQQRLDPDPP